jgi:hypothetical protein
MNTHESIRESIAAYALDALDPDERRRVQQDLLEHLPGCADCSATMRELREVADELATGVDPVAPSRELEQRLLDAVRGEPRARTQPARRSRFMARIAVAAVVVGLAGSVALNVSYVVGADRAERDRIALAAMTHPDARTVALRGDAGSVLLVYRPQAQPLLVASGLPAPPAGRVYELWFLDGATPVPVRTFVPNDGRIVLELPKDPSAFRGAAITIEEGFVTAPTTDPVYAGTIAT